MKTYARSVFSLIAVSAALAAFSFAAENEDASLYLVHGIPGRNVAATMNPQLPVDVFINDSVCYLKGFNFDSTSGPLTLPGGSYDVKISQANSLAPCTNPPLAESTLKVGAGSSSTAVVALDSTGTPALLSFADNLTPVKSGYSRFTLANAADAGTLEVTVTQQLVKKPITRTFSIKPGSESTVDLPIGVYSVQAVGSASSTPLVSATIGAENQAAELQYFVGSASNGSLSMVTRIVPDVF